MTDAQLKTKDLRPTTPCLEHTETKKSEDKSLDLSLRSSGFVITIMGLAEATDFQDVEGGEKNTGFHLRIHRNTYLDR